MSNASDFFGGGGSGTAIGETKGFYVDDNPLVLGDEVWLKTGTVDDDVASYPDAKTSTYFPDPVFNVVGTKNYSGMGGLVKGSVNWYQSVGASAGYALVEYDANFTFIQNIVLAEGGTVSVVLYDLTWDGTNFWIVDPNISVANKAIHKYDSSWNRIPAGEIDITGKNGHRGLTNDGTYLYMSDSLKIWRWLLDGTGETQVATLTVELQTLTWDGTNFYGTLAGQDAIKKYDSSWNEIPLDEIDTSSVGSPTAIDKQAGQDLVFGGSSIATSFYEAEINQFPVVGISTAYANDSNLPYYVRIK